jgi:hypothetical protein
MPAQKVKNIFSVAKNANSPLKTLSFLKKSKNKSSKTAYVFIRIFWGSCHVLASQCIVRIEGVLTNGQKTDRGKRKKRTG